MFRRDVDLGDGGTPLWQRRSDADDELGEDPGVGLVHIAVAVDIRCCALLWGAGDIALSNLGTQSRVEQINDTVTVDVAARVGLLGFVGADVTVPSKRSRPRIPSLVRADQVAGNIGAASRVDRRTAGKKGVSKRRPAVVRQWAEQRVLASDIRTRIFCFVDGTAGLVLDEVVAVRFEISGAIRTCRCDGVVSDEGVLHVHRVRRVAVDTATVAPGSVAGHRHVVEHHLAVVVESAGLIRSGVATDRAVGELCRAEVVDAAALVAGRIIADRAVIEGEFSLVVDASAEFGGVTANRGIADLNCPRIGDAATPQRPGVATDATVDECGRAAEIVVDAAAVGGIVVANRAIGELERAQIVDPAAASGSVGADGAVYEGCVSGVGDRSADPGGIITHGAAFQRQRAEVHDRAPNVKRKLGTRLYPSGDGQVPQREGTRGVYVEDAELRYRRASLDRGAVAVDHDRAGDRRKPVGTVGSVIHNDKRVCAPGSQVDHVSSPVCVGRDDCRNERVGITADVEPRRPKQLARHEDSYQCEDHKDDSLEPSLR